MRVLVAFECSGIVREAFIARGHDAWSCDLERSRIPGPHICADITVALLEPWDLMIAHPPCDHLAASGRRWFHHKQPEQDRALDLVQFLWNFPIEKICIENPVGVLSTKFKHPTQKIQPYQFGHGEMKKTCLWLKNLPKLRSTFLAQGRWGRTNLLPPSEDRKYERSKTYTGIAAAMAEQWG